MECQILFTGKNKKNIINLSFAENAHRVVKDKRLGTTKSSILSIDWRPAWRI